MLALIKRHINQSGFHVHVVTGESEAGSLPRFAYTIGLRESLGSELAIAGAAYYMADEVTRIVNTIGRRLMMMQEVESSPVQVDGLGRFSVRPVHDSWARPLLLGVFDYYKIGDVAAYQIVPDEAHWTIDTPDLGKAWSATEEPIWRWLHESWPYAVPPKSTATTNLNALRGSRITEVVRWEEDEWEIFAGPGPDVTPEEMRVVPLACLLGADPSLRPVVDLERGGALWRDDDDGDWQPWGKGEQAGRPG